ncbi:proline--tRNA ligase [Rothia sp. P7181]|uniref:proline--tRNA ligase n=1 Tax=unclassified Rothia (in: high G+C Gram-positive bacteria) TaxID=2689056 RepID=UPI003ACF8DD5
MAIRLSQLFLRTLRDDPSDAEVISHKLLVRAGYIRRAAPGIYTWLPLGLSVLNKVQNIVREEMNAIGAQEVHFPALLPREPYEATNRWDEYGDNLFRLKDRKGADMLLAPTHEEMFTLLVKDLYTSYKDLPVYLYQIQTKYRDEARPRAGLLRGREFVMKDSYSFNLDDSGLEEAYNAHRGAYQRIFERLGLEIVIVQAQSGAMGGSRSEEFLHPTPIGEDTFVRSAGGYAANVEAVTTYPLETVDASNTPAASVRQTPQATTIESLVQVSNELYPRENRPWEAKDTLKTLIVAVILPDGERRLAAIGIPGDRNVDLSRVEVNIGTLLGVGGEVEVEPANENDLKDFPQLVKGYIGPGVSREQQLLGEESATGIPFYVDPRIVEGSAWIAGANQAEHHVYDAVVGRDFVADAVIEACEVREGDMAPDGSGELYTARGIEMGHIFQLGRKYAEALELKVLDHDGKLQTVTMGSYGVGVTRALAAIAEKNNDEKGLIWPRNIAPADVHVVATGKGEEILAGAQKLVDELEAAGIEVIFDDRPKVSPGVKFKDSELLGVPTIIVVGRGYADGKIEIRDRRTGSSREVNLDEAVAQVQHEITAEDLCA